MASDGTIKIATELDESGLKKEVGGLNSKLGSLAKSGFGVLAGAVAAGTAAMAAGAAAGINYNATMEGYRTSFATMLGSAEDAEKLTATLKEMGAQTPFEMTDLADATQTLMSFGLGADEATSTLSMLGDISQGNAEKLGSITRAFGKMSSSGKVSLEDINIMIDQGFNPLQEMSETTGESMASLYDRISAGSLSVDEVTAAMQRSTAEGGMYFESMKSQSETFNGQMSTLKDNAMGMLGAVTEGITSNIATTLMPAANNALSTLTTAFATGGIQGMLTAGGQIIMQLLQGLANNIGSITDTGIDMLLWLIDGISGALPTLIPLVYTIISNITKAIWNNMPQIFEAGVKLLVGLVQGLLNAIPVIWSMLPAAIDAIINFFKETDWGEIGSNIMDGIGKGISNAVTGVTKAAKEAVGKVVDGVKDFLGIHSPSTLMRDLIGKNMMAGIGIAWDDGTPDLTAGIKGNIGKLVNGVQSEVGKMGSRITAGGQVAAGVYNAVTGNNMDYDKLGTAVTQSFVDAGIGISIDGREFGRVQNGLVRGI